MASRGLFRRLAQVAVVATASSVVLVSGVGSAFAGTTTPPDHSQGTAGTTGVVTSPQPLSTADQNTGGANGGCLTDPTGIYCSTRDGSPSGNGNGGGNATGKPCAGCVGQADNKNPPGQEVKDPFNTFPNNGYECDKNKGIGQTNPAHTGCTNQTIAAVIDICSTNDQAPSTGSLLAVEGTSISSVNPLAPTAVVAGDHTVDATAPTGYHFVQCAERQSGSSQNITSSTAATEGVNVPAGGSGVAYFYVELNPTPPPATQQSLGAVIYVCGTAAMQAPKPGSNLAIEGTTFSAQDSLLAAQQVTVGDHTVDATAPTGYHFDSCGETAQTIVSPTSATEGVNVPAGETRTAIFWVSQDQTPPTPTQTLAVNVFVCSTGQDSNGATISTTGAETITNAANPFGPTEVPAGTYTVSANPPSGFTLVACGHPGSDAPQTVVLPVGGSQVVNFYVAPVQTPPEGGDQTLAGVIYLCSNGHVVSGGTLSATGGGQTFTDQANPFGPVSVPAGDYSMTATAPAGFHLVVCNEQGSTGTETVTVPENGAGVGTFYVAANITPPTVSQTLAGVIYVCSSGMPVSGGSLSATGPQTLSGQANPFGPTNVTAGDYTMTATAPAGFHLVVCNGQGSITTETVTVPAGGAGVGRFFVAPDVTSPTITQTLAGVILVCSSGQLVPGGSLTATGANGDTTQANPYGPQMVAPGVYTVTATAPDAFHLVVCNGAGSTGSQQVTVPAGGAGVATFFVAPTAPVQVLGEKVQHKPGTPGTPKTPGTPATPNTPQVPTEIPTVAPTALPMTGTGVTSLLPGAMGMMAAGLLLVVAGRRRRRA